MGGRGKMTEEEKKAIELLKQEPDYSLSYYYRENAIDIVLKLLEKQESEINKLNNVIDKMAEILNNFDYDKQCESCRTDICSASVDGTEYIKCIKEYFMKE